MSESRISDCSELTIEQRALWEKLTAFSLDDEQSSKPFSLRLAEENGWSREFALRAIEEYRRFLFLAAVVGHVVCPSEEVDAVWHQHLVYSRSYWTDLCQDVLGFPLHHDPTSGGPEAARQHWDLYRQTLASYRRVFQEEPPRDIWPLPFERFDPQSRPRTINLKEYWIVRKPSWWPRLRARWLSAAFLPPIFAVGLEPFDWPGPEFLFLFVTLYLCVLVGSLIYRHHKRDITVEDDRDLTTEEIACLSHGRGGAVNSVVAGMLQDGHLKTVRKPGRFLSLATESIVVERGSSAPPKTRPLATAIFQLVREESLSLDQIQKSVAEETEALEESLRERGYLLTAAQSWPAQFHPALALLALLVFGICKVAIGLQRNRPVELLVIGCIVTFVTVLFIGLALRRSLAGDRLLAALRSQHSDLKHTLNHERCTGLQVALGAALFGAVVLENPLFADLKVAWRDTSRMAGDGSSGGGCGGGCGGGGCGGGGCGGCGG